jgi:hypothetical protein
MYPYPNCAVENAGTVRLAARMQLLRDLTGNQRFGALAFPNRTSPLD